MINHKFISISAVQIYDISYIDLHGHAVLGKPNAHQSPQREGQICKENSLRKPKIQPVFLLKKLNYLPWLVCMKHSRPFCLNQQTTPFTTVALILLHVEDEHKILGAVVVEELFFFSNARQILGGGGK